MTDHIDMDKLNWMREPELTPVQQMLLELYSAFQQKTKKWRVQDKEISRRVGIPPTTWEGYINGDRIPALDKALLIADAFEVWIDLDARSRWMKVIGKPDYIIIRDPKYREIYRQLPHLPRKVFDIIYELATNPDSINETWLLDDSKRKTSEPDKSADD